MTSTENYWFYKDPYPDVSDNEYTQTVTISNNLNTQFITGSNASLSNAIITTITTNELTGQEIVGYDMGASNIYTHNAYVGTAYASNVYGSNIEASDYLEGKAINVASNLYWMGHSLYDECPVDTNDWNDLIPFKEDAGMIHVSWLRKPVTAATILEDLFKLGETAIDLYELLNDLKNFAGGTGLPAAVSSAVTGAIAGGGTSAITDALGEALDGLGDSNSSNKKIPVSWSNLTNKPLANTGGKIGIDGNMLISGNINFLNTGSFITDVWGNKKFVSSTSTGTTIIDSNQNIYGNVINASNVLTNYINGNTCNSSILFQDNTALTQLSVLNKNNNNNDPSAWTSGIVRITDSNLSFLQQRGFGAYDEVLKVTTDGVYADYYNSRSNNGSLYFPSQAVAQLSVLSKNNSNNDPSAWTSGIIRLTDSNLSYLQQRGFGVYDEVVKMTTDGVFSDGYNSRSNNASLYFPSPAVAQLSTLDKTSNANDPSTWTTGMVYVSPSNMSFLSQTGFGNFSSNMVIDKGGSLFVRSNLTMNGTAIVRAVGTTDYTLGYPVAKEGLIQFDDKAFRYIQRASNMSLQSALSNVIDTVAFSVNSNGLFLLTNNALYGKVETVEYPNPVNPLSNLSFSNFSRLTYDLNGGLVWGVGLSNDNYTNLDIFSVSRQGELKIKDFTTSLMETYTTSNASLVRGKTEIKRSGEIYFNNKVFLNSNGTLTRSNFTVDSNGEVSARHITTSNLSMGDNLVINSEGMIHTGSNVSLSNAEMNLVYDTAGLTLCNLRISKQGDISVGSTSITPNGDLQMNTRTVISQGGSMYPTYLEIGKLKIYQDGSIYWDGKPILNEQGKLVANAIDYGTGNEFETQGFSTPQQQNVYSGTALDY